MRILFAIHNFPSEFTGGTEVVALAHARALRARGHALAVLAGSERRSEVEEVSHEDVDGIPVLRILRRPGEDYAVHVARPRVRALFERSLADIRPDVVHVHHWATLGSDLVRAAEGAGIPAVVTLHDLWTTCPRFFRTPLPGLRCPEDGSREPCLRCVAGEAGLPEEGLRREFEARDAGVVEELNAASAVLAPSRAHAATLARLLPGLRAEIRVVPHGLPSAPRAAAEPRSEPPFRIGSFGNLGPEKGTHLFLEAAAGCPARERAEWSLEGRVLDPAYEETLRRAAGSLLVRWGGPFEPRRATEVAARLDLAVFPSLAHESYGMVVDEAFAAGVPVLVSDRGALPERAGEGGIVVPAGDVAALRAAIEVFLEDPARRERLRFGVPRRLRTAAEAAADLEGVYRAARRAKAR